MNHPAATELQSPLFKGTGTLVSLQQKLEATKLEEMLFREEQDKKQNLCSQDMESPALSFHGDCLLENGSSSTLCLLTTLIFKINRAISLLAFSVGLERNILQQFWALGSETVK